MTGSVVLRVGDSTLRFNYSVHDSALFLALGAAVAEVQSLEFHLVTLVALAAADKDPRTHEQVSEEYFAKTLGAVARKLKGHAGSPDLCRQLDELVAKRNYLVHGFLRAHQWPMLSASKYVAAIRELDEMTKLFRTGGDVVTIAVREVQKLPIWLIRTNPATGLPEVVE